jgi:type 1 fimbria pilin
MLSTFNRNKSKLAIATLAAGLGLHLASNAQAANDAGTLIINGQISSSTCVLGLGDGASTVDSF